MSDTKASGSEPSPSLIPKAGWFARILEKIPKQMRLFALVALVVFLILMAILPSVSSNPTAQTWIAAMLIAVLLVVVVAATAVMLRDLKQQAPTGKFRENPSGPLKIEDGRGKILSDKKPRPDLDTWHRKLRPALHQASFYTVPTYYLDTDLNILDYNIAFEIVFQEIAGRLRGQHVTRFIARLMNNDEVFEHGREFTQEVERTGRFPFVDLEHIVYESRDFGVVEFTKVASQLHDEDGNLQGWAVALMIRRIRWDDFERVLKEKLYLDKLWSVYSGPYDRILTHFPPYLQLIQEVTAVVTGENRSVVDLGAGSGNVTVALLERGHRVTAVENNVGMLDHLAMKTRDNDAVTIVKASVENLECLADKAFDAVVMVNVLYAVDDPLRCLKEIHRILAPGGVLGFSTTHSETHLYELLESIKTHNRLDSPGCDGQMINDYDILARVNRDIEKKIARRHTIDEYREWVREAGFEISQYVESTYRNSVMLIHAKKVVSKIVHAETVERDQELSESRPGSSRSRAGVAHLEQPYTPQWRSSGAQIGLAPARPSAVRTEEEPAKTRYEEPLPRRTDTTTLRTAPIGKRFFTHIQEHKWYAVLVLALFASVAVGVAYILESAPRDQSPIPSVAVLPFANNDPNMQYISDGISESLINGLSGLSKLKVIAREESFQYRGFQYRGRDVEPKEVAKSLSVLALVTGKVERQGDKLSISAWLVDPRDKTQMWGAKYDRRGDDLGPVQSEIVEEIAAKLQLSLTASEHEKLIKDKHVNPQAYELLLKGRFYQQKLTNDEIKRAIDFFKKALVIDPKYALAQAALAGAYLDLTYNSSVDPNESLPVAEAAATSAVGLDESLADAHIVLGRIKLIKWEWADAGKEIRRAIELSPNLAAARTVYWLYLSGQARHTEAVAEAQRARDLSPSIALVYTANLGYALYFARQYEQAIEPMKKTLELDPAFGYANRLLGYVYAAKGMYAEAIGEYEKSLKLNGDSTSDQCYRGYSLAMAGRKEEAARILRGLLTTKDYVSPAELAVLYAGLGRTNDALASLERAYTKRDLQIQYLNVEPHYDSLRAEPRFKNLVERVRLAP